MYERQHEDEYSEAKEGGWQLLRLGRFLDAQVGKVMKALKDSGRADRTIVIFTSDHGFHLGEHDFWAKVSLLDESSQVPLIISVLWA